MRRFRRILHWRSRRRENAEFAAALDVVHNAALENCADFRIDATKCPHVAYIAISGIPQHTVHCLLIRGHEGAHKFDHALVGAFESTETSPDPWDNAGDPNGRKPA